MKYTLTIELEDGKLTSRITPGENWRQFAQEFADALTASERQRKELEATAAVLAGALTASERWMGTFLAAFSVGKLEPNHPILQARHILANLPQAVQQHLERDKEAELGWWTLGSVEPALEVLSRQPGPFRDLIVSALVLLAAYRVRSDGPRGNGAAGGEVTP